MSTLIAEAATSIRASLHTLLRSIAAEDDTGRAARMRLGNGLIEEAENAYQLLRAIEQRLADSGESAQQTREVIHSVRSDKVIDARTFAAAVHDEYADEFARHRRVAELLERAVVTPRTLRSAAAVAVDILLCQAYVAHMSVRTLAELGHTYDGATIARRILELAVRAKYLAAEDKPDDERAARVNDFLGRLWRRLPPELQATIPDSSRTPWEAADATLGKAKGGHEKWWKLFEDVGHLELYRSDYADLSAIAHGSPFTAPLHYAEDIVPLRDIRVVPAILNAANRYYLAVAVVWNAEFHVIEEADIQALVQAEVALRNNNTEEDSDTSSGSTESPA